MRILIIDDDNRNIFALTAILKSRGHECLSAEEGRKGLELIKKGDKIDVVLLDMMMPDFDGYQLLQELRSTTGNEKLPVIAVTAQAMPGDKEKCLKAGANDYIPKPVDIDKLTTLLDNYSAARM